MRAHKLECSVLAALVLATGSAGAQQKAADPPKEAKAEAPKADPSKADPKADPSKAGSEEGKEKKPTLTPGYSWTDKPAKPGKWRPKKKLDPNAPIAMFPGFRMLADGSSQVWVHVTKKVNVTAAATSFALVGAQVNVRNNTNALVTEFFDTPLARARLKPDATGAQLVLELRESVAVKHRVVDAPGGSMMLYIDLPKAQKSYSVRDDFAPDTKSTRSTGKVLPGKRSGKRGPSP